MIDQSRRLWPVLRGGSLLDIAKRHVAKGYQSDQVSSMPADTMGQSQPGHVPDRILDIHVGIDRRGRLDGDLINTRAAQRPILDDGITSNVDHQQERELVLRIPSLDDQ